MSYREIHELFVVCDECHTSLSVDDATYEDADNEAVDHGWQCDEFQGRHYCPLHWHVECHDCDITDSGAPGRTGSRGMAHRPRLSMRQPLSEPPSSLMPRMPQVGCRTAASARIRWMAGQRRRFQEEPLPGMRKKQEGNEMKVKKVLIDMIVKWHQAGYSLDEIAPLVPQVSKEEIKAIIQQHHE